ncbi:MAG: prepilin-type N-terminal cleavage/methylation domain-containing protein [Verrucomicrobia bacterium]|nr:prepilin-type N-terminal cleavage/methylation domain-containing protein [Verrucomicrobiota bacterium]
MSSKKTWPAGFSLVELLMVVTIIGIVTAIVMPNFVASMKGNRLRSATRTVVSAGRYARSQAVLKQRDMALVFDLDHARVAIHPMRINYQNAGETGSADQHVTDDAGTEVNENRPSLTLEAMTLQRTLVMVKFEYIEVEALDGKFAEGEIPVIYRSNGTCMPYSIRLADEQGTTVDVFVDALSSARTEN